MRAHDRKLQKYKEEKLPESIPCRFCKYFEWGLRVAIRTEDGHCLARGIMRYHGDPVCPYYEKK